jgi:hypothetical protein
MTTTVGKVEEIKGTGTVAKTEAVAKVEPVPIDKLHVTDVPSMKSTFDPVTGKYVLIVAEHLNPAVAKELVEIESSKVEIHSDESGVTVIRITVDALTGEERAAKEAKDAKEVAAKAKAEDDEAAKAKAKADAATAKEAAQDEKDAKADEAAKARAGFGRR